MRHGVVLLPGIITPADLAYGELRQELGGAETIVLRDLAIYDADAPPAGYGLDTEVEAILETAARAGFGTFHLAGYSAGGAAAAAFAARHPERLVSLGLFEPAWFGNDAMADDEHRTMREFDEITAQPPEQAFPAFVTLNLAPGVQAPPPPPGPPPVWMAKRPAGMRAIMDAFRTHRLDVDALRGFRQPVLFVLGGLSNPALYKARAERVRAVFSDFTLEEFAGRHHFDPPHRAEAKRLAAVLRAFWTRAESISTRR